MKYSYRSDRRAVTLVELILAVLLLSTVILTGLSMELGLRKLFTSTDLEVQVLDESAPIVFMITKDINRGIGDIANLSHIPFSTWSDVNGAHYSIYYDANGNGKWDDAVAGGDNVIDYVYKSSNYNLSRTSNLFPPPAVYQMLSNRVVNFSISAPVNGVSNIFLRLILDPTNNSSFTNPEVTVNSSSQYRGNSLT